MTLERRLRKLEEKANPPKPGGGAVHLIDSPDGRCHCRICKDLSDAEYEAYHTEFRKTLGSRIGYIYVNRLENGETEV